MPDAVRIGLIISFSIHAMILVAASIVLPDPDAYKVDQQESIPVEIVEFADKAKRVATAKDAKEAPKKPPAPPKVEKVGDPKPPVKEPDKVEKKAALEPQPAPEPDPVPQKPEPPKVEPDPVKDLIEKTPDPEPVPDPKPEVEKKPEKVVPVPRSKPKVPKAFKLAQKKKKKKKHKFNPNELSALLNKIEPKRTTARQAEKEPGDPTKKDIASLIGDDDKLTGSEADWLRQKIQQCWSPPTGARGAENLVVKVRFQIEPDGSVPRQPVVLNRSSDPLFGVAAQAAVRAVMQCQPYNGLPPEKYRHWRDNIVNFDPSRMLATN